MKKLRKTLTLASLALAAATPVLTAGTPAFAASRDGACDSGEFCYYYNSDEAGSISDFTGSVSDYGTAQPDCYDFKGAGSGKGLCVKNNAASVWNRSTKTVRVYFNSGYAGSYQDIKAGAKANLNATLKNNNASHKFLTAPGTAETPRNDYDGNARGFAQNNCTAFAAYRIASRLGKPNFNNYWGNQHWGDAGHWDDAARAAAGVSVDKTPKVGAIAVNDVHKVGHVAYVNKVYTDGSFDVEEYNWNNPLAYGTRSHVHVSNAQADFQWMLHF